MSGFSVKVEGFREIQEYLRRVRERGGNFLPVMQDFGERMRRSIEKNFREGGRPEKWKPSRRVMAGGGKTLIDTGALRASITYTAANDSLTIGTNKKYARILQEGGPDRDITIRPRSARALAIRVYGATPTEVSPKTGRAIKGRGGAVIFRKSVTVKKGTIPARPFLVFQDEDFAYLIRRAKAYALRGRQGLN